METVVHRLYARGVGQVEADLRADPWLKYLLAFAAVLAGFWFWHRIPNFATRDEHSRIMDALVVYGELLEDPSFEGLREGVTWSRVPFGATLYLYALAVLPVFLFAWATGQADIFLHFADPSWEFGFYESWAATPEWLWTWTIGLVRLFNVAFAVGCVYLTYRIGTAVHDRAVGRLSALLLTLTFGFLTIAHEAGEDMPAAFFLLVALYGMIRYVQDGDELLFLAGSFAGGVAIAFKLTAAPVVGLIGLAYLLRARTAEDPVSALFNPVLVVTGALLGLVAILLGFPTFLVAGLDPILERIFGGSVSRMTHATGPDAPIWWWFARGYFSALGIPLFVAAVAGVGASVARLRERGPAFEGTLLVLAGLAAYIALFSRWHDFRVHHLLPTFPLIAVLLGASLERFRRERPALARPLLAVLLVTTGIYAGVGVAGFASMPRDQANAWLQDNADENATMEIYRRNMQDAVVPHGMTINHAYGREGGGEQLDPCPDYIQLGYRDLLYLQAGTYYRNGEAQATYLRALLEGGYNYSVAADFGPRPPNLVPQRAEPGSLTELVHMGIIPQTDQFADEQELAENQYTLILERTGACDRSREPPF